MPERLVWDQTGERLYETGVDRGVLYPIDDKAEYPKGVPWNGMTAFNESPSGADSTSLWANNGKYLNLTAAEEFGYTLEAYTYPDEFEACDGSKEVAPGVYAGQQERAIFGFSCRTLIGNDVKGNDFAYKLHLVWGSKAEPTEKSHSTVNESPEAASMSWTCSTTPVPITVEGLENIKATSHFTVQSNKCDPAKLKALEDILYGTSENEARLPLPDEVITLMKADG